MLAIFRYHFPQKWLSDVHFTPFPATLPKQANCEYYVDTVGDERVIVNKQEIGEDESEIEIDNTKTPGTYFDKRLRNHKTSFSCSTQLSMKFTQLINVKMTTIVGMNSTCLRQLLAF